MTHNTITSNIFGHMPDGQIVEQYTLSNTQGMSVSILNLGGIIKNWQIPNNTDQHTDIVLGFDDLQSYLNNKAYIGAVVGRFANRIAKGRFSLHGKPFQLPVNLQGNCLHGGMKGFDAYVWKAEVKSDKLELSIVSPNGDQEFPGELHCKVVYQLSNEGSLRVEYHALSDQDTVFNPTQHSYFNLAGHDSGPVNEHLIQVNASHFTPANEQSVPTGEIRPVAGSDFDLRQPVKVADANASQDPQIKACNGLDHNWCLDGFNQQSELFHAATLHEPDSGRQLQVHTNMPGMQVYTANFLASESSGKDGAKYGPYHAVCLETQFYPDAPNKPNFPSAVLTKNQKVCYVTEFKLAI